MYRSILVPLDGSDTAARGLHEAMRLVSSGATRLVLLHVVEDTPRLSEVASRSTLDTVQARRRAAAKAALDAAAQAPRRAHVAVDTAVVLARDTVPQAIIDTARERHCDLIVIGTHGRTGLGRALIGSVAEHVARHVAIPVMLVPPGPAVEAHYS